MENWYAPGEVRTHQMSDEERQLYAEKKRKRYPWETKKRETRPRCASHRRAPFTALHVEKEVIGKWK